MAITLKISDLINILSIMWCDVTDTAQCKPHRAEMRKPRRQWTHLTVHFSGTTYIKQTTFRIMPLSLHLELKLNRRWEPIGRVQILLRRCISTIAGSRLCI